MKFITIDQMRIHCKADPDGDQDSELTIYANAAEAECERQCGRFIYPDDATQQAAKNGAQSALEAAKATYDAALTSAEAISDQDIRNSMVAAAVIEYGNAALVFQKISRSVIAGDDFAAAVLLTAGHYFRNRENVAVGQTATAVPQTAAYILAPYVYYGG